MKKILVFFVLFATFFSAKATSEVQSTQINNVTFYYVTNDNNEVAITNQDNTYNSYGYTKSYTDSKIEIPSEIDGKSVTEIGVYAFFDCDDVTEVVLPNTIKKIDDYAFYSCNNLSSINFPSGLTSIGYATFYECIALTSVELPNTLKTLEHSAFRTCTSLSQINIPENIESIGSYAFADDPIVSIEIPAGVRTIEEATFYNCSSLKIIKLHEGLEKINYIAFYLCQSIISLNIPSTVNSIARFAFGDCWAVKTFIFNSEQPATLEDVSTFDNPNYFTCYVPSEDAINAYKIADFWYTENENTEKNGFISDFVAFFKDNDLFYTKINDTEANLFYANNIVYDPEATEITIPDTATDNDGNLYTLTSIGEIVFADYENLEKVTIDGNSTVAPELAENAFSDLLKQKTTKSILVVPDGASESYSDQNNHWIDFFDIKEISEMENNPDAISKIEAEIFEIARYNITGQKISEPTKGINIIKYSDGSTKKELIK